jgi:hypothetical protein
MDDTDILKLSGASAGTVGIVLLVYRILKSVIGKRFISTCCGQKFEVALDIKDSVPTPKEETCIEIKNPMPIQNEQKHTTP